MSKHSSVLGPSIVDRLPKPKKAEIDMGMLERVEHCQLGARLVGVEMPPDLRELTRLALDEYLTRRGR